MLCLLAGSALACASPKPLPRCDGEPPRPPGIVVAGSGVWSELARRAVGGGLVAESIGSGGAVKALRDGAIDVGLMSRPVKDKERWPGLVAIDAGRSELRFVGASGAVLIALYTGERRRLPNGMPARLFVREPGDSGWSVICGSLRELCAAMRKAVAEGRAEVAWTDAEMRALLVGTPGAVGPIDASLWPIEQSSALLATDAPLHKPLVVIHRANPAPEVAQVVQKLAEEARRARP